MLGIHDKQMIYTCCILGVVALMVFSAMATLTNPTDRVVYYYKWSRHDR